MKPEISALLTTRNRSHLLPRVLEGLATQTLDRTRFEIIVVDDGSTDETPELLQAWQERLPMRVVRQNHAGLAAAKNLGIFVAIGAILLFLDDDDVADPNLLAAHLATHHAHPDQAIGVLGYTNLAPDVATVPVMHHVTQVGCQLFSYGWMKPGQVMGHTEFWGGRSSCKRSLLIRNGVFHPDFDFGSEDIELAWRLTRYGFRVVYEPRARSVMIRALTFDEFCVRSYRQGRSQYRFAQMHNDPQIREYCQIDEAKDAWVHDRVGYAAHLRQSRKLDNLARAWQGANLALPATLENAVNDTYRKAFFLSRVKGISDAAALCL